MCCEGVSVVRVCSTADFMCVSVQIQDIIISCQVTSCFAENL